MTRLESSQIGHGRQHGLKVVAGKLAILIEITQQRAFDANEDGGGRGAAKAIGNGVSERVASGKIGRR